MMDRIKAFLFEKFVGKILARLAVTIASACTTGPVSDFLASYGVKVVVSEVELATGLIAIGHLVFEWLKARAKEKVA